MKPVATYLDIMNEIRMSYPVSNGAVFILLEGPSDGLFYRRFFDTNICKIYSIPGGKLKLEEGLTQLVQKYPFIIGIRDADFLHLEQQTISTSNLFVTDYHDLEMGLVANDEIFSAVVFNYSPEHKSEHNNIRSRLLNAISFIGYMRWYNELNGLGLNFEGSNFGDLYDHATCSINIEAYILKLMGASPKSSVSNTRQIEVGVNGLMNITHELLQLCNGHDFIKIMAAYSKCIAGKQITDLQISSNFRAAYSLTHFKQTKLYLDTLNWATANNVKIHYS